MELFETSSHYVVQDGQHALWCCRETGFLEAHDASDILHLQDPLCLGLIYGVIGRVQVGTDPDCHWLLIITRQTEVGVLPGTHPIFRIDSVVFLPLTHASSSSTVNPDAPVGASLTPSEQSEGQQPAFDEAVRELLLSNLHRCSMHSGNPRPPNVSNTDNNSSVSPSVIVGNVLNVPSAAASGVFKRTFSNLLNTTSSSEGSPRFRRPESRTARRILESLDKLFNDSPSFYYSPSADITASTWRISANASANRSSLVADDRFFFNRALLSDLLNSPNHLSSYWIVPIIQGFVQFEKIVITIPASTDSPTAPAQAVVFQKHENSDVDSESGVFSQSSGVVTWSTSKVVLQLGIISRRSRHRAGTRYKKRGADEHGHCANYVETEQVFYWPPRWCSYVIVRGSVPLYWSQSGIQYRPPPRLEKTSAENSEVFASHFEREMIYYNQINIVNLLHQSSKEEALCNAFAENVLYYNSPSVTYISFDFNEHWDSSFTWIDGNGRICEQNAVFRVNCLDCLDRTNIVEAAISRVILEVLCSKMGILNPDSALPTELLRVFKTIWANNGDALSHYTRTGEHGVTAALKDGFNSANRYYLNQFQDVARQAAIDICLGIQPILAAERGGSSGGLISQSGSSHNLQQPFPEIQETLEAKCENLLATMDDVRRMLLTEEDLCLGSWLLFDSSDPSVTNDGDFDVIMILSLSSVFIVRLDVEGDPAFYYDIPLTTLEKVECGPLALSGGGILPFKKAKKVSGIKITYKARQRSDDSSILAMDRRTELCFVLRTAKFRLFSGVLIPVENVSDSQEVLTMICECFRNVTRISNSEISVEELSQEATLRIDKKKAARIDNHPSKIMWADSSQTMQALTIRSLDAARQSVEGDGGVSAVANAPKKIFDKTIRSFSSLLKQSQPVLTADQASAATNNKGRPLLPQNSLLPSSSGDGVAPSQLRQQSRYRPSPSDEWKREIVKQMSECRTRIIQL